MMTCGRWVDREGSTFPLGMFWDEAGQGFNFALYSEHATGVTLLFYSDRDLTNPLHKEKFNYLRNKSAYIWHCRVPAHVVANAKYYALQVEGPQKPEEGYRFDPEKVLLDPYAKAVFLPPGFSRAAASSPGTNAGKAPLGLLARNSPSFDWGKNPRPCHDYDTIVYELHVKGFTKHPSSGVDEKKRGTYLGVVEKIPYLKELGVTVVELMPVYQFDPQEENYWGYMPLNFFSPHQGYATSPTAEDAAGEFGEMVKALHEAGIEVVLDVVYNHTTEGDHQGPTYNFRGIDNLSYYLLTDDRRYYRNDTGTGNTLHTANRFVRRMITESLAYWGEEMHIDGFRFDLASIFSRDIDGSINLDDPAVVAEITTYPLLIGLRMIAEVWDLTSYQLGRSFPGTLWLQWNGRFRDDIRGFVRGDTGKIGALMTRIYGSDDLFPDDTIQTYRPYQSVNFITAHDGFTLYDLVSYNEKHNEANGHNNTDGANENLSWNCGWEGDKDVPPEVIDLRKRQIKNFAVLLFLSNGTPMFFMGDEFMHTQNGNNNPYNQDNETTWLNWDRLKENGNIFRFFRCMIAFRKAHPSLARSRFWRGDVKWHGPGPDPDLSSGSRTLAFYLNGASEGDDDIYAMFNSWSGDVDFTIQEGNPREWKRVIDTNLPSPEDFAEPGKESVLETQNYTVKARSAVVLLRSGHS